MGMFKNKNRMYFRNKDLHKNELNKSNYSLINLSNKYKIISNIGSRDLNDIFKTLGRAFEKYRYPNQ